MIISLPVQSEASLERAVKFLDDFNNFKEEFQSIGCSVDIPKIHAMQYYDQQVRDFWSPDNFDTEDTEHQHISDAKNLYRTSNKCEPVMQMLYYVHCRTAIEMKHQYLEAISLNSANPEYPISPRQHSLGS